MGDTCKAFKKLAFRALGNSVTIFASYSISTKACHHQLRMCVLSGKDQTESVTDQMIPAITLYGYLLLPYLRLSFDRLSLL